MNLVERSIAVGVLVFMAMAPVTMLQYVTTWLLITLAQAGMCYYSA
jgi:hypothetical protein